MKKKTIIIAEAGVNHNGDLGIAKKLVDIASNSGADYVKFQTFKAETIVSKIATKAKYQIDTVLNKNETQYEMLKKLELSEDDHFKLFEYCNSKKIKFLSTAFDLEGLDFLNDLGIDLMKIPSGEITNFQYLKKIASFNKPIVLSTGMASLSEIEKALNVLRTTKNSNSEITVLHCNTAYPTPMHDVNLHAMINIKDKFGVNVGYSDHTLGIEVSIASVALGAEIIEKHITLDKNLEGPDHKSSLNPNEFKQMVKSIRNIDIACSGSGIKTVTESEKVNKLHSRKSIHLKNSLSKGDVIKESDLIMLRPGDGISPMEINKVLGSIINKNISKYSKINFNDFY